MTAQREPLVDVIRGIAVAGVVLGHWLVTAIVAGPTGFTVDSPLRWSPGLAPVSWLLQTLGLFFVAGGYAAATSLAAARARGVAAPRWWLRRLRPLVGAVLVVAACWAAGLAVLALRGLPQQTVSTVAQLLVSPLWFVLVHLALLALTPVACSLDRRLGLAAPALLVGVVALVDLAVGTGVAPAALGWVNLLAAWWASWQFGVGLRRVRGRTLPALLLAGGAGLGALLVGLGYPASAVGVTGAARSNLFPPSLAAVALAAAQVGAVLLAGPRLARLAASGPGGAVLRWVNRRALPVFLLHQTALVSVTLLAGVLGALPGLHQPPTGAGWVLARLAWLPVFAALLAGLLRLFQPRSRRVSPETSQMVAS